VTEPDHRELMAAAIERDAEGQRALFAGDGEAARRDFADAAALYRRSWEAAPPRSFGRLLGMLKSAVLAGEGEAQAAYALSTLGDEANDSPAEAYVRALAELIQGEDAAAIEWSQAMRAGSDAFVRTADAIEALAAGDAEGYAEALEAIVRDFEQRTEHLTKVAIADTALMLELLAARRGISAGVRSRVLPPR
jgi:hypothetical protein